MRVISTVDGRPTPLYAVDALPDADNGFAFDHRHLFQIIPDEEDQP